MDIKLLVHLIIYYYDVNCNESNRRLLDYSCYSPIRIHPSPKCCKTSFYDDVKR